MSVNLLDIEKIELELSSDCNAACPGCARTQLDGTYEVKNITFKDVQRLFPSKEYIDGKQFKICGVLGDPIVNPECSDILTYLAENGGYCVVSTNGSYNTADWWIRLAQVSHATSKIKVHFCVDGHRETNHIYRVNTKFNVLERNMEAYSNAGGIGDWIYIVFDHNEHELEIAKSHAQRLGFKFKVRTGMRNSYHDWIAKIGKKNQKLETKITTTGDKEHTKVKQVDEINKLIKENNEGKVDHQKNQELIKTINCKYIHQNEIFISSTLELWPCCFLFDSTKWNKHGINEKYADFGVGWNSLVDKNINKVLTNPYFDSILIESWNPVHGKHLPRCLYTCGKNAAYHNEIKDYA